jgi:hypothetical protein
LSILLVLQMLGKVDIGIILKIDVIYLDTRSTATYNLYRLTHMLATACYLTIGKNPRSHDTIPLRL